MAGHQRNPRNLAGARSVGWYIPTTGRATLPAQGVRIALQCVFT